jgi:hypothetical protein
MCHRHTEHSVTQKFQPFTIAMLITGNTAVRQSLLQQLGILETIL